MTSKSLCLLFASLLGACLGIPQYGDQGGISGPYNPVQSNFCSTGQDCVPWQRCVDGYIVTSGILGIDQRTQPANYNELQCGDAGNMCCNIPEQGSYDEIDACGHVSYSCVPYFQCSEGKIVTDGAQLIDVRITPQGVCTNPDYPDVPAVCCLKPGYEPIPEPSNACPGIQECVAFEQCDAHGNIITDGSGLIDIRTGFTSCFQHSGIRGRCCNPPIPHVGSCPSESVCVPGPNCYGQAMDVSNAFIDYISTGQWTTCSYGSGNGVCCKSLGPHVGACPSDSVCTLPANCYSQALDGSNNFIDYVPTGIWTSCDYTNGQGVCCKRSAQYLKCPEPSVCVPKGQCSGSAYSVNAFHPYPDATITDWTACDAQGGVCCASASGECGIANNKLLPRITANIKNEALFGEFPWQAIIFDKNYVFICGAVLISHIHVLTAAHCVDEHTADQIQIRLGEYQVNSFDEPLPYSDHGVASVTIHSGFNVKNLHNDIALIVLKHPVPLQYHINSICLPDAGTVIPPYTECYASGWGKDAFVDGQFQHILKKIKVPFVDYGTCQDLLRKTRLGRFFKLDKSFVCAGGEENKDACYGDGGGPLVCRTQGHNYVLAGITSWGIGCGTKNVPGVYVNVQHFNSWINGIVAPSGNQQTIPGYGK